MKNSVFEIYRSRLTIHLESKKFTSNQRDKVPIDIPKFCPSASEAADILAILQDPGKSGAETTRVCSLSNADDTSKNHIEILSAANVAQSRVVFWNFYGAFGSYKNAINNTIDQQFWADRLSELINLLENVKVVVVCGNDAWSGLRYFRPSNGRLVQFISAPHPSKRGLLLPGNRDRAISAWSSAKELASLDKSFT